MLVMEFLRTYTSDLSRELLTQAVGVGSYLSALTEQLKVATLNLESGLFSKHPGKCELINSPRCTHRGSSRTYNRDTQTHRTTYRD